MRWSGLVEVILQARGLDLLRASGLGDMRRKKPRPVATAAGLDENHASRR
eukprot:CAMPEP_0116957238 /NCGR_PEP_ID=MMETSP0467-20121206/43847_1 /TAXON_ID=283647 /ORGANISM="Mesodinium pulex, Strain SPMC105" /LENGTH=49 /DNA_ID= /DNA_START= /DNA_END= /DNA_ORIENTATION=